MKIADDMIWEGEEEEGHDEKEGVDGRIDGRWIDQGPCRSDTCSALTSSILGASMPRPISSRFTCGPPPQMRKMSELGTIQSLYTSAMRNMYRK